MLTDYNRRNDFVRRVASWRCFCSLVSLAFVFTPSAAHAEYQFCNKTSYVLMSAVGYQDKGRWHSEGWWQIQPGRCETVIAEPLDKKTYYTFARSVTAHKGGIKYFAGNQRFCVSPEKFKLEGRDDCERRNAIERMFTRIDIGDTDKWTTSFTETTDFSLERARVAGVQRLLTDLGKRPGRIDGLMGKRTRDGIYKFKRANGLKVNQELTVELFDNLLVEAGKIQEATGYSMCNETDFLIYAAIGRQIDGNLVSTGWFRLDPDTCMKAIKDNLNNEVFYTYAEAQGTSGKQVAWGGPHNLCTMDNRFTIVGRDDCEKRGFRKTGFERVETGAKPGWTQTFTLSEEH